MPSSYMDLFLGYFENIQFIMLFRNFSIAQEINTNILYSEVVQFQICFSIKLIILNVSQIYNVLLVLQIFNKSLKFPRYLFQKYLPSSRAKN